MTQNKDEPRDRTVERTLARIARRESGVRREELASGEMAPDDFAASALALDGDPSTLPAVSEASREEAAERQALQRVSGLSTELEDVTEVEYRQLRLENVVLIGVYTSGTVRDAENSLAELAALAETAGSHVLDAIIQRRPTPDPATYFGRGKAAELAGIVRDVHADTVIADTELAPSQRRALEDIVKVKVVDRTALILDIFAQHARSREGKAQVELAQLEYLLPRLRGWGESMSRQAGGRVGASGGGIGARGPGQTKIEIDRRHIHQRMARLRREIAQMKPAREGNRATRRRREVPSVAVVGYTNAGKSSLLNALTGADLLVENALFATLDATVRRTRTESGREYTLTDTVGFVRNLPHQLVEAFRSTLEEAAEADLLVHVVDGAHPDPLGQIDAVHAVLEEVGARDLPEVIVFNKIDLVDPDGRLVLRAMHPGACLVSTRTGEGIRALRQRIEGELPVPNVEMQLVVPYDRGDVVSRLHETGDVLEEDFTETGTLLHVRVRSRDRSALEPFSTGRG